MDSPGDGHCLLHSVVNSHNSQHPAAPKLTKEASITSLQGEVSSNVIKYVGFRIDNSSLNLFSEMKSYVKRKVYDTLFGDAVPLILANVLQMNIIIIKAENTKFECHIVEYESNIAAHIENSIFVYKVGEHYNAIVPLAPRVSANTIASRHGLLRSITVNGKTCVDKNSDMIASTVADINDSDLFGHAVLSLDHNLGLNGSEIKFCSWNICGLTSCKLNDDILGGFLKQHDIVLLTETWAKNDDNFHLENHVFYNFARNAIHPNAKRSSGGIGVFIKRDIIKGVDIRKHTDDIISWIKLKKAHFGLVNDIYIGNVYMVPHSSNHVRHDAFDLLQNDIADIPLEAEILVCGDHNAHTNIEPDYFDCDWGIGNTELDDIVSSTYNERCQLINCMYEGNRLDRFSKDARAVNNNGRQLLDISKTLVIVNGRLGNDKGIGRATRVMGNHSSVVDYVIANPKLFEQIRHFEIHDKLPESDHLPMTFSIKCNGAHSVKDHPGVPNWTLQKRYDWSTPDLDKFKAILNDDISYLYRVNIKKRSNGSEKY